MGKWAGIGCVILVVAACAGMALCSAASARRSISLDTVPALRTPFVAPVGKVGSVVGGKNWTYTVQAVQRTKALPRDSRTPEPAKGEWVIVRLTVTNIGRENFPLNRHDFELYDSAGVKYVHDDTYAGSSYVRDAKLTDLGDRMPPGVPVQTALVFDVNPMARGLRLKLVQEDLFIDLG